MAHIRETIEIQASPDAVRDVAGDPARIAEWLPLLASSRADGEARERTMAGGGELRERILEHSDERRFYSYEIVEAPMPVRSYRSRLSVTGHDGHAHVDCQAEFEPEDAGEEPKLARMFESTYRDGLKTLRRRLEG